MSIPAFPEIDPAMTCESALNMILVSIAMEEIALSRIIDAESDKIKYILDKKHMGKVPDTDEIIAVNKSVAHTLEAVSQNQMLLKNKMDKAISALACVIPGQKGPPGPDCVKLGRIILEKAG